MIARSRLKPANTDQAGSGAHSVPEARGLPVKAGESYSAPIPRNPLFPATLRTESGLHVLLAMQKVEGANPFSRSQESHAFAGLSAFLAGPPDAPPRPFPAPIPTLGKMYTDDRAGMPPPGTERQGGSYGPFGPWDFKSPRGALPPFALDGAFSAQARAVRQATQSGGHARRGTPRALRPPRR